MSSDLLQSLNFLHLYYFYVVAREGSVSAACDHLHLTQPTISMQIRKLENVLGHKLFTRNGRGVALTAVGKSVFDYAEEIFSIGRELMSTLRGASGQKVSRLHVGILEVMPKHITFRLLQPVLALPQPVQIVCHEASLDELTHDLARHRYDVILSDTPIHGGAGVRTFNHPLGETGIAICASREMAAKYRARFPDSLDGAPFLLPAGNTEIRRAVDSWFDQRGQAPHIVGVFDDSALIKEFGQAGAGLFPVPSAAVDDVTQLYQVELVGMLEGARVHFFAITPERKIVHPAVVAISQSARHVLNNGHVRHDATAASGAETI
ncbi:MAG: LysR family transcriptional regulator [Planctomycetaceae bacterium]|nr:LysR family transcriptional regulator [Planctomycetaceae bacterium]